MDYKLFACYILLSFRGIYNPIAIFLYLSVLKLVNYILCFIIWIGYGGYPPYTRKVQVKKIVYRLTPDYWNLQFDTDFLDIHQEFRDPKCILDENVHIYNIDEHIARFVRIPCHVNIYESSQYSAVSYAMFQHATHVYEMPVRLAIDICKDISIHDIPTTILAHTGRCGSTLLANIFTETKKAAVLSIPEILGPWCRLLREGTDERVIKPLIHCGLTFLLRPTRWNMDKDVCFIKPASHHISIYPLVTKVFPQIRILLMTRKGLNVCHSFISTDHMPEILFRFPSIIRFIIQARRDWLCMCNDLITDDITSCRLALWTSLWATKMQMYFKLCKENNTIEASTYEDLVEHREQCIAAIFKYCGLDPKLCHTGVKALGYHSQKAIKSLIRTDGGATSVFPPHEGKLKVIADSICDQWGVPRIDEDLRLPGQLVPLEVVE